MLRADAGSIGYDGSSIGVSRNAARVDHPLQSVTVVGDVDFRKHVRELARSEERRGEGWANLLRFGVAIFIAGAVIDVDRGMPKQALPAVLTLTLFGYISYTVFLFLYLRGGHHHPVLGFLSVTLDASMTTLYILWSTATWSRPVPGSALILFVLGIVAASLRHRPGLVIYSGLLNTALASAVGVYGLQQAGSPGILGSPPRAFSPIELVQRSAFFLAVTLVLAFTTRLSRHMIHRTGIAVQERLRDVIQLNAALEEKVQVRAAELERALAQRAAVDERVRIAREMHDGLAKSLSGLALEARALDRTLAADASPASKKARYIAEATGHLSRQARQLIADFRATADSSNFLEKLRTMLAEWHTASGIQTALEVPNAPGLLPPRLEYEVLRIVEEALTNVQRHSQARSANIVVSVTNECLEVLVHDNGRGFAFAGDWRALIEAGRFGLLGMRERAQVVGGVLTVESSPALGTTVRLRVPVPSDK